MANHFEAKLHGFRRTQDGVVISYVIHPNDVKAELATAALGTRYVIAFEEINDDETANESPVAQRSEQAAYNRQVEGSNPSGATKQRTPFDQLPATMQAAMRCADESFQRFVFDVFWRKGAAIPSEANAAQLVRDYCGVSSRKDLNFNEEASRLWLELEAKYQAHLTDQRYSSLKRQA